MAECKNFYVSLESGDSVLVYTYELTEEEVKAWVEKHSGEKAIECYHIPQDQLQFYCIGLRLWADTPELAEKFRKMLNAK